MQKSHTNLFIAKKDLPANLVARGSCHCDGTCPQFLSLRWNLPANLVIAMELARSSCHCDGTCPQFLSLRWNLPLGSCHCEATCSHLLSLRWSETTEAIFLQATLVFGLLRYARNDKSQDRHTAFAMTILNLSLRAVQKARRGNLLAMTTC
ncbi:MAG: hypothetical protein J6Q11_06505, partial [Fibrobacteraceae bacterium]|nr:hypothetical protein [Fibrobacteraceae bacterium]